MQNVVTEESRRAQISEESVASMFEFLSEFTDVSQDEELVVSLGAAAEDGGAAEVS
ncbi:MAG: hypothetical protein P8P83_03000 [Rickettsiaceae bacterium]|nr:hypothetical protein [Rickettsiaceae bacterium]